MGAGHATSPTASPSRCTSPDATSPPDRSWSATPTRSTRLLRYMLAENPRAARFVPFIGPDGTIDRAKLETALDHGFCIVRWHPRRGPS